MRNPNKIHRHRQARRSVIVRAFIVAFIASIASILSQVWVKTRILASDRENNDQFGSAVAITSTHALVGARNAEGTKGAAYLFSFTGTSWTQSTDIKLGPVSGGKFGYSVALSSKFAIVGASNANSYQGLAILYTISGLTWTEINLSLVGAAVNAYFGISVAVTDIHALIGAHQANGGKGAAYLYRCGSDGVWTLNSTLTSSDAQANSNFGSSVALTDSHAAIGSYAAKVAGSYYGGVYVFSPGATNWEEKKKMYGPVNNGYYGYHVAIFGDHLVVGTLTSGGYYIYSRSGDDWVLKKAVPDVGGPVAITNGYAAMKSNLYALENGSWNFTTTLDASSPTSVAMFENFVIIGSTGVESGKGEGLIFKKTYTESQSQSQSISPSPEPVHPDILAYQSTRSGNFGSATALMNNTLFASSPTCIDQSNCDGGRTAVFKKDINGDYFIFQMLQGRHRNMDAMFGHSLDVNNYWLAITSKGTSYHSAQAALVNIFGKNPDTDTIERVAGLRPKSSNQPNMDFGHSIAVGQFDIIVGVPGYDLEILIDVGAVMSFRFRIATNRWGRNPVVATAFDATAGDRFGHSVSFDEAFLAVGNNPSDDTRYAVYILTKSGFEFAHFYKISGNGKRGFGWKVLLSEDELIVGSPQDDDSGASTNGGCVSAFAKNSTNHFVEYETIRHTPSVAERRFGFTVARKGNRMAIGTNTCPNGAPCALQGKAYLYTKSGQQWVPRRSFSSGHVDGSDSFGTRVTINEEDFVVGAPNSNNGSGRVYVYYVPEISG